MVITEEEADPIGRVRSCCGRGRWVDVKCLQCVKLTDRMNSIQNTLHSSTGQNNTMGRGGSASLGANDILVTQSCEYETEN